jgi:thiamine biosynthesis lipoprotein
MVSYRGEVFGTTYLITFYSSTGESYQDEIEELFEEINQSVSYYRPNSVISMVNNNETNITDAIFQRVYLRSVEVFKATEGAFDPTVSPLVNAWGFGFANAQQMTREIVDSILEFVGLDKTRLVSDGIIEKERPEIQFDFNAIAKGYAADLVGELLLSKGVEVFLVEIGGDLTTREIKPDGTKWRVALENPAESYDSPQQFDYFIELENQAVATSGNYRRYFEADGQRYSHTIDPNSGYPVGHSLLGVSVVAQDCITADAYATAFMVMGLDKSIEYVENDRGLEAFFIYSDGKDGYKTHATSGLFPKRK